MRYLFQIITVSFFFIITACDNNDNDGDSSPRVVAFCGVVQKGPFCNGSKITISDLDKDLNPTGKTYFTTVSNDKGEFSITKVSLTSGFVELSADGFYFDENSGTLSSERLSLGAICNISDTSNIIVNILTHLEKERVKNLCLAGEKFSDAKKQAQKEVLAVFGFSDSTIGNSEKLNIIHSSDGDAILLATSVICQGTQSVADLSKMLADIVNEIKDDGSFNNDSLKNQIIQQSNLINIDNIKANLKRQYNTSATITDFEKYVNDFKLKNPSNNQLFYSYPVNGNYGPNLLVLKDSVLELNKNYSLTAIVPKNGKLKVVMKGTTDPWYYMLGSNTGWYITTYDEATKSQTFTSTITETALDLNMMVNGSGKVAISIFENNSSNPSLTKSLTYGGGVKDMVYYPDTNYFGQNILALKDYDTLYTNTNYSIIVALNRLNQDIRVNYTFNFNKTEYAFSVDTSYNNSEFNYFMGEITSTEIKLEARLVDYFYKKAMSKIIFSKPCTFYITGYGDYTKHFYVLNK